MNAKDKVVVPVLPVPDEPIGGGSTDNSVSTSSSLLVWDFAHR